MIYLLLALLLIPTTAAATVLWFAGGETGEPSVSTTGNNGEFTQVNVGGILATTAQFRSGAYSVFMGQTTTNSGFGISKKGLNLTTGFVRLGFRFDSTPDVTQSVARWLNSSQALTVSLYQKTDKTLCFFYNASQVTCGATVLSINTWYLLEFKSVVSASVGGMELKINGVVEFTSLATDTSGQGNLDQVQFGPAISGGGARNTWYDDMIVNDTAYIGNGHDIARQGTTGTPTYNTWTLNGTGCAGASIDTCWSNTPFTTTTSASSATTNASQTMINASFGSTQSGHGTETIDAHDTINGCKAAMMAKSGTAAAPISIRHRLNGTDTDTAKTLTTSDVYYDDVSTSVWTTTTTILRSGTLAEVGVLHGSGTASDTVEDMWLVCDYGPASAIRHRVTQ